MVPSGSARFGSLLVPVRFDFVGPVRFQVSWDPRGPVIFRFGSRLGLFPDDHLSCQAGTFRLEYLDTGNIRDG